MEMRDDTGLFSSNPPGSDQSSGDIVVDAMEVLSKLPKEIREYVAQLAVENVDLFSKNAELREEIAQLKSQQINLLSEIVT